LSFVVGIIFCCCCACGMKTRMHKVYFLMGICNLGTDIGVTTLAMTEYKDHFSGPALAGVYIGCVGLVVGLLACLVLQMKGTCARMGKKDEGCDQIIEFFASPKHFFMLLLNPHYYNDEDEGGDFEEFKGAGRQLATAGLIVEDLPMFIVQCVALSEATDDKTKGAAALAMVFTVCDIGRYFKLFVPLLKSQAAAGNIDAEYGIAAGIAMCLCKCCGEKKEKGRM